MVRIPSAHLTYIVGGNYQNNSPMTSKFTFDLAHYSVPFPPAGHAGRHRSARKARKALPALRTPTGNSFQGLTLTGGARYTEVTEDFSGCAAEGNASGRTFRLAYPQLYVASADSRRCRTARSSQAPAPRWTIAAFRTQRSRPISLTTAEGRQLVLARRSELQAGHGLAALWPYKPRLQVRSFPCAGRAGLHPVSICHSGRADLL
jgi:hypothetical protein